MTSRKMLGTIQAKLSAKLNLSRKLELIGGTKSGWPGLLTKYSRSAPMRVAMTLRLEKVPTVGAKEKTRETLLIS